MSFFAGQVSNTFVQKWAIPIGRTPVAMALFEPLIPGVLLTHFADVEAGRLGFMGGMRGPNGGDTFRWFWEQPVTLARERGSPTEVLIQRSDTFQRRDLHTELGGNALWILIVDVGR